MFTSKSAHCIPYRLFGNVVLKTCTLIKKANSSDDATTVICFVVVLKVIMHHRITAIKSKERGQRCEMRVYYAISFICHLCAKKYRRGWSEMNKDITVY